ncbi:hypothetical protein ACFOWB_10230 [Chenggangzhangella methanolivorans]|uniref:hypothetical protein n=1 Tax=Chenggangzhangella methanolivorans TaxID=1437009 RepID=UPI00360D87E1
MKISLIKALAVALAIAAPTAAFAAPHDGLIPGVTFISANTASADHAGRHAKPVVERAEKGGVLDERKGGTRPAPLDDPYARWDANTNAG